MILKAFLNHVCEGVSHRREAEILTVRVFSVDEHLGRLKRLIGLTGEACQKSYDRSDFVPQPDRTLVRLPGGGRAEVFHASGAMRVVTGLETMGALFERIEPPEALKKLIEETARRLRLDELVARHETLDGRYAEPVLCRAVGAYRQSVGGLPVLGAASVAVKVAQGGALDSVAVQVLESSAEPFASAPLIEPEDAARQLHGQLEGLMGRSGSQLADQKVSAQRLQLGYIHLGKRKSQRLLAPHYVASIRIEGEEVQAYNLVVAATARVFQPLCAVGTDAPVPQRRRAA
jgi:hypothetical protein